MFLSISASTTLVHTTARLWSPRILELLMLIQTITPCNGTSIKRVATWQSAGSQLVRSKGAHACQWMSRRAIHLWRAPDPWRHWARQTLDQGDQQLSHNNSPVWDAIVPMVQSRSVPETPHVSSSPSNSRPSMLRSISWHRVSCPPVWVRQQDAHVRHYKCRIWTAIYAVRINCRLFASFSIVPPSSSSLIIVLSFLWSSLHVISNQWMIRWSRTVIRPSLTAPPWPL